MLRPSSVSFSTHHALLSGIFDYSTWTRKKRMGCCWREENLIDNSGCLLTYLKMTQSISVLKEMLEFFSGAELGVREYQVSIIVISKAVEVCPDGG